MVMLLLDALNLHPGKIIAYVGAGGKSTAIWRLSNELLASHERVVVAPTSHILEPRLPPDSSLYLSLDPEPERLFGLLDRCPRVFVAAARDQPADFDPIDDWPPARSIKLSGLPPGTIDQLAPHGPTATWLIEADGSRRRLLKAPAAYEPALPACATDVIIVASLDAIGQPLNAAIVHRAEIFTALAEAQTDQPIAPDQLARVLLHPHGGLKNVPPGARVSILLTQRDPSQLHPSADTLASMLAQSNRIQQIVVASLRADHPILYHSPLPPPARHLAFGRDMAWRTVPGSRVTHHVAGILLAAGQSTRFHQQPKQLLDWHGRTFIDRAIDAALTAGLDPVIVVVGAHADRVRAQIAHRNITLVDNADWARGQSTSVKAGLAALPAEVEAVIFMPIDQPQISAHIIGELIDAHAQTRLPIVVASVNGRRTTPALFHRSLFPDILQIEGDRGARQIIDADASRVAMVEVDPALVVDIDTLEDYNRARGEGRGS